MPRGEHIYTSIIGLTDCIHIAYQQAGAYCSARQPKLIFRHIRLFIYMALHESSKCSVLSDPMM